MNRIALGTAQFGLDYGVNNKSGKIPSKEAWAILATAIQSGIDTFDTAHDYGESELVLSNFIKSCSHKLKIVSKLPQCTHQKVEEIFKSSLNRLNLSSIYGYLIHSYKNYREDQRIWNELEKLKNEGRIEKIGFSLYFPTELESVLQDNLKIDIMQVPFSIFDQRFNTYFPELKKRNIEIYARSVFLQGLVFKKPEELDKYFAGIKEKMSRLNFLSEESGVPVVALCFDFVFKNELIDKIVVGVDNLGHLNEIINSPRFLAKMNNIFQQLSNLKENDEKIILPFNWNT